MADKPAHIITIPDSLGRDVDKFREGRGPAPDVSAFMSDESLAEVAKSTAAAVVRQEDLRPITAGEAASRITFDGEHVPSVPRTARVLPAPFRRSRISIDHHGRQWQTCRADRVAPGDMVPDLGRVASAETVTVRATVAGVPGVAVGMKVLLTGVAGNQAEFEPGATVRAFRLAE
jgi:hypothetical protein